MKSHEHFKNKHELPFELIADTDGVLCHLFDVIKMKNMYGKQVRGVERSTFVFDSKGILKFEWRGLKVLGHVDEVLKTVVAMS
jgi:peroxiredoxin Q/BCP